MSVIDKDVDVAVRCIEANRRQKVHRESMLAVAASAAALSAVATLVCGLVCDRSGAVLPGLVPAGVSLVTPFPPTRHTRTLDATIGPFTHSSTGHRLWPAGNSRVNLCRSYRPDAVQSADAGDAKPGLG